MIRSGGKELRDLLPFAIICGYVGYDKILFFRHISNLEAVLNIPKSKIFYSINVVVAQGQ